MRPRRMMYAYVADDWGVTLTLAYGRGFGDCARCVISGDGVSANVRGEADNELLGNILSSSGGGRLAVVVWRLLADRYKASA